MWHDTQTHAVIANRSLAGLLLVFSGFLFAQATAFPSEHTDDTIINRYRYAARFGVALSILCLVISAVALWWLLVPSDTVFAATWIDFLGLLGLTAVYGGYTIMKYL